MELLTILLPILGLAAFFFFAGQDILQSNCPNCGKSFQILKSSLKDGPQLCPYCTQPFSVQGNKFVRESAKFSSGRATTSAQAFSEFFKRGSEGKTRSGTVVDIGAEVKDFCQESLIGISFAALQSSWQIFQKSGSSVMVTAYQPFTRFVDMLGTRKYYIQNIKTD